MPETATAPAPTTSSPRLAALRVALLLEIASTAQPGPDGKPGPQAQALMQRLAQMPDPELLQMARSSQADVPQEPAALQPLRHARHSRDYQLHHPDVQEAVKAFANVLGIDPDALLQGAADEPTVAVEEIVQEPEPAPADDEDADVFELAMHHATTWNRLREMGLRPSPAEVATVDAELRGSGWRLAQDGSKQWVLEPEEGGVIRYERRGPRRYAAERAPKGGVDINGKRYRGGQWIPAAVVASAPEPVKEKLRANTARHEEARKQRHQTRKLRGSVDVARLRERLAQHTMEPLTQPEATSAGRSFRALHRHHGELTLHRIEELAEQAEGALRAVEDDDPNAEGKRRYWSRQLAKYHGMLAQAEERGVTGQVQPAVPQGFLSRLKAEDVPYDLALRAHEGTSFVPETRARQRQQDYLDNMRGTYESLSRFANTPEKKAQLDEEMERYREGWLEKYRNYLHANSRIVSSMIAGPSNFPSRQMEKRGDTAHKRLNELLDFEKRATDAIRRKLTPEEQPIKSADSDAVQRLQAKLAQHEALQERMKAINTAHARFLKNPATLESSGLSEEDKQKIRTYKPAYSWEPHPYPPYAITNNGAEIRRLKGRIDEVSKMQSSEHREQEYEGGISLVENPSAGRVQILFPGKPDEKTRDALKHAGFRWSPTEGAWQRHLNNGGRYAAENVLKQLGKEKVAASEPAPAEASEAAEPESSTPAEEKYGFTGTDSLGREWQDGKLVPREEPAPQPATPAATPEQSIPASKESVTQEQQVLAEGKEVPPEVRASVPAAAQSMDTPSARRTGAEYALRDDGPVQKWVGNKRIPSELRNAVLQAVEQQKALLLGPNMAAGYVSADSARAPALGATLQSAVPPGKEVLGYLVLEQKYKHPDALSVSGNFQFLRPGEGQAVKQKVIRILADAAPASVPQPAAQPAAQAPAQPATFRVGQNLTYTGKAGAMPAEFRGFHNDPMSGEKLARVIVRPESGPPFEASVKLSELSHSTQTETPPAAQPITADVSPPAAQEPAKPHVEDAILSAATGVSGQDLTNAMREAGYSFDEAKAAIDKLRADGRIRIEGGKAYASQPEPAAQATGPLQQKIASALQSASHPEARELLQEALANSETPAGHAEDSTHILHQLGFAYSDAQDKGAAEEIGKALRDAGAKPVDTSGGFNAAEQDTDEPLMPGDPVEVVRPGYEVQTPQGGTVLVAKAKVRKAAQPEPTPAATAAGERPEHLRGVRQGSQLEREIEGALAAGKLAHLDPATHSPASQWAIGLYTGASAAEVMRTYLANTEHSFAPPIEKPKAPPKPPAPRHNEQELRREINAGAEEQQRTGLGKQASDLTLEEFLRKQGAMYGGGERAKETHRRIVEGALNRGKPVPPEVLRDYPDLAGKTATAATAEPTPETSAGPPEPGFTGVDSLGRRWENGRLVPKQEKVSNAEPTATPEAPPEPAGPGPNGPAPAIGRGAADRSSGGNPPASRPASAGPRIVTVRQEHTQTADTRLVPESVRQHLNDTQQQGVALAIEALSKHGGVLNADGTGVGKTRQELGVAQHFLEQGKKVVIVAPAEVIKPNWAKGTMTGSFADDSAAMGVKVKLVKGDMPLSAGTAHVTTYNELGKLKGQIDKDTVIIWDESHQLKNKQSQRFKHAKEAMDKAHAVAYFTATPGDKPLHIAYLARANIFGNAGSTETYEKLGMRLVDQHTGGGSYVKCWQIDPRVGYKEAARRLSGLFDQLTRDGLMIKRELAMDNVSVSMDRVSLSDAEHRAVADAYQRTMSKTGGNKAVALMTARLHQEPFKIPATTSMVQEELAAGRSPIVFLGRFSAMGEGDDDEANDEDDTFSAGTAGALRAALIAAGIPENQIGELHGGATKTPASKKKAMDDFQAGKTRVMIATVQSGGTGINLDDRTGDRPRTVIVMTPPFTANDMTQAIGRVHRLTTRSDSKVRGVLADTHIDDWNAGVLEKKFQALGAMVQGEATRGRGAIRPEEAPDVDEGEQAPFEWGESLKPIPKVHYNTPFAHNDLIGTFGGKRVQRDGQWTTQFPSQEKLDAYKAHVAAQAAQNKPKPAAAPAATSTPPAPAPAPAPSTRPIKIRKVMTKNGERYVHSFAASNAFWRAKEAGQLPRNVSASKNPRTGDWEVAIWGGSDKEIHDTLPQLQRLGIPLSYARLSGMALRYQRAANDAASTGRMEEARGCYQMATVLARLRA